MHWVPKLLPIANSFRDGSLFQLDRVNLILEIPVAFNAQRLFDRKSNRCYRVLHNIMNTRFFLWRSRVSFPTAKQKPYRGFVIS
jgi:hypothetical protein